MASHEIQKMHDQNPKTHSEQTTQQSHVIAFHALTQPVMHVKICRTAQLPR